MKNLTWQNPEQLFVAQELINKVKSKCCGIKDLYRLTSSCQIPHYKPSGKQIYFDRSEIEEWLKRNRVDSVEEIEQAAINHVVMNKKGRGRV